MSFEERTGMMGERRVAGGDQEHTALGRIGYICRD